MARTNAKRIGRAGLTYVQAVAVQEKLRGRVERVRRLGRVRTVAGIDCGFKDDVGRGTVVVMTYPQLEVVERVVAERPIDFPYIPGLLSFREVPVIKAAFRQLQTRPDLALVDGMGLAHPRRIGLACHLGLELDLPTIGCGKSLFVGTHSEPRDTRGARAALRHDGEVVGCALRTRVGTKPIYVSIGHRVDLRTATRWVLRCTPKYRLPEPIRAADRLAGERG